MRANLSNIVVSRINKQNNKQNIIRSNLNRFSGRAPIPHWVVKDDDDEEDGEVELILEDKDGKVLYSQVLLNISWRFLEILCSGGQFGHNV